MKASLKKRFFAVLLAVLFTAAAPLSSFAATDYTRPYELTLDRFEGMTPSFGSVGGEWLVFALARSGRVGPADAWCSSYYSRIERMIAANESGAINSNKLTENSRLVIALTSIGRNARDVSGYDLVEPLTNQSGVKRQGVTGAAFALLALDSRASYGETATKNAYVDFLLGRELAGGGWVLGSGEADPDVTGIVITALAPYQRASSAIERAVARLSLIQDPDGGFTSFGTATCESCAQVVTALSTVGIDPDTDQRFIKNGHSLLSALTAYFRGSGFAHISGGVVNQMASEQAAYALCAYSRYRAGQNDLYNMSDVTPIGGTTPKPTSTPKPTPTPKPTATPNPSATPKPTPTPKPTVTPTPTATPKPTESPAATDAPLQTQTAAPTAAPTEAPTDAPTDIPTDSPTDVPSELPTGSPTSVPTPETTIPPAGPTAGPTAIPATEAPSEPAAESETPAAAEENGDTAKNEKKPGIGFWLPLAAAAVTAVCAAAIAVRRKNEKKD